MFPTPSPTHFPTDAPTPALTLDYSTETSEMSVRVRGEQTFETDDDLYIVKWVAIAGSIVVAVGILLAWYWFRSYRRSDRRVVFVPAKREARETYVQARLNEAYANTLKDQIRATMQAEEQQLASAVHQRQEYDLETQRVKGEEAAQAEEWYVEQAQQGAIEGAREEYAAYVRQGERGASELVQLEQQRIMQEEAAIAQQIDFLQRKKRMQEIAEVTLVQQEEGQKRQMLDLQIGQLYEFQRQKQHERNTLGERAQFEQPAQQVGEPEFIEACRLNSGTQAREYFRSNLRPEILRTGQSQYEPQARSSDYTDEIARVRAAASREFDALELEQEVEEIVLSNAAHPREVCLVVWSVLVLVVAVVVLVVFSSIKPLGDTVSSCTCGDNKNWGGDVVFFSNHTAIKGYQTESDWLNIEPTAVDLFVEDEKDGYRRGKNRFVEGFVACLAVAAVILGIFCAIAMRTWPVRKDVEEEQQHRTDVRKVTIVKQSKGGGLHTGRGGNVITTKHGGWENTNTKDPVSFRQLNHTLTGVRGAGGGVEPVPLAPSLTMRPAGISSAAVPVPSSNSSSLAATYILREPLTVEVALPIGPLGFNLSTLGAGAGAGAIHVITGAASSPYLAHSTKAALLDGAQLLAINHSPVSSMYTHEVIAFLKHLAAGPRTLTVGTAVPSQSKPPLPFHGMRGGLGVQSLQHGPTPPQRPPAAPAAPASPASPAARVQYSLATLPRAPVPPPPRPPPRPFVDNSMRYHPTSPPSPRVPAALEDMHQRHHESPQRPHYYAHSLGF
jgi:hypothetical protein